MANGGSKRFPLVGGTFEAELNNPANRSLTVNWYPSSSGPNGRGQIYLKPIETTLYAYPSNANQVVWSFHPSIAEAQEVYFLQDFPANTSNVEILGVEGGSVNTFVKGQWQLSPTGTPKTSAVTWAENEDYLIFNSSTIAQAKIQILNKGNGVLTNTSQGYKTVTYLDGYFITHTGRSIVVSDLEDPTTIDGGATATSDVVGGDIIRVESLGDHLWVFTATTIQVWYNSGNPDFPFEPVPGTTIENVGLYAPIALTKVAGQNRFAFVGVSSGTYGIYITNGFQVERISNPKVERWLELATSIEFLDGDYGLAVLNFEERCAGLFMYSYTWQGHTFIFVNNPGILANNVYRNCFVYDISTGIWHNRHTDGINGNVFSISLLETGSYAYTECKLYQPAASIGKETLLTGPDVKAIVKLDDDYTLGDYLNGTYFTQRRARVTSPFSGEDHTLFHHRVRLDFLGIASHCNVQLWSWDDDEPRNGSAFTNHGIQNLKDQSKIEFYTLGMSENRSYWVDISNTNQGTTLVSLTGGFTDVTRGWR